MINAPNKLDPRRSAARSRIKANRPWERLIEKRHLIDDLAVAHRSEVFVTLGEETSGLRQTQGWFDFACRLIWILLFAALVFTALVFAVLLPAPNPDQSPRSNERRRRLDPTAGLRRLTPLGRFDDAT